MSKIDLCDEMTFSLTKNDGITLWSNLQLDKVEDNLVHKAAVIVRDKYAENKSVEIKLDKKIPVAAGLAGGSSNAATTIMSLSELWELNLSQEQMEEVGSMLGSDVNFFLGYNSALAEGRGEKVRSVSDIELDMMLLVKPNFGISTKFAYSLINEYGDNDNWRQFIATKDPNYCFNRFDRFIRNEYPEIDSIMEYMEDNGAVNTIVSGSGSTIVGYYDEQSVLDEHYHLFGEKKMWTYKAKTLRSKV